jgi:hypothetical protein
MLPTTALMVVGHLNLSCFAMLTSSSQIDLKPVLEPLLREKLLKVCPAQNRTSTIGLSKTKGIESLLTIKLGVLNFQLV